MKTRKVQFHSDPKCNKELFPGRKDIPVCMRRSGLGIHTDFRPVKRFPGPDIPPIKPPGPDNPPIKPPGPDNPPVNPPVNPPGPPKKSGKDQNLSTGEIIGIVGAIASTVTTGAGVISQLEKAPTEFVAPEVELATIEEGATTGESTAFETISQAGIRNRFNPVEEIGSGTTSAPAEITAIEEGGVSAFEVAGESVVAGGELVEGAAGVAAVGTAGTIAAVGSIAMGAVATVGALGYFIDKGLFDFQGNSSSFQKGAYNTAQEIATLQPPKLMYVEPPGMFASTQEQINYYQAQSKAQSNYNTELSAYQTAVKQPTVPVQSPTDPVVP